MTGFKHSCRYKGRVSSDSSLICRSAIALLIFPAFILLYSCTEAAVRLGQEAFPPVVSSISLKYGSGDCMAMPGGNNAVDIFIYNDDEMKRIDSYQRLLPDNGYTVAAASRPGKKIIVAICNPLHDSYDWNDISSVESISALYADLADEDPRAPLMSGIAAIDAYNGGSHDMTVSPIMSEIYLRSIRTDFSGKPYSSKKIRNACVYLANVNTVAGIVPGGDFIPCAPVNTDGTPAESAARMKNPELVHADFGTDIGEETVFPDIRLYCYPNSAADDSAGTPFTRLVIAGEIDGHRYYYPININKEDIGQVCGTTGIGRNCRYVFDIIISKTGSDSPLLPVSPGTVYINSTVEPWETLPESQITF